MKNITWRSEYLTMEGGGFGPSSIIEGHIRGYIEGPIPYVYLGELHMAVENALNGASTPFKVEKVIFNNPATIILWTDGTKTVVKCQPGDIYSKEVGFITAYLKKLLGNDNTFNNEIAKWVPEETPWEYFKRMCMHEVKFEIPEDEVEDYKRELGIVSPSQPCELCEDGDEDLMKKTIRRKARGVVHQFEYCPACGRKLIKTEE